jgi:hypothetical protein
MINYTDWATRAVIRLTLLGALAVSIQGCGDAPKAAAVDTTRAREALQKTLDHWKSGGKPGELATGSPAITAQDIDWVSGSKLVDYQLANEGTKDDANLRVPVQLKILDPSGRQVSKRVSYVVGTSPSVTVFREL